MPLREEPSASVPGLPRKPNVSQFTGLPAPSPLRKSLRAPGDAGLPTGSTVLPAMGKRSSTSWLLRARETRALETTSKRTSTLGPGVITFATNKRKSSEMLEAGDAVLKSLEEEERAVKVRKLGNSPATDIFLDIKGKGRVSSPDMVGGNILGCARYVRIVLIQSLVLGYSRIAISICDCNGASQHGSHCTCATRRRW